MLNHREKFNKEKYEISSFDAKALFTSINVNRVISYVLDIIYKDPKSFFKQKGTDENDNEVDLEPPPREIFREFFHNTLLQYSSFCTVSGYYRQIEGVSMGSRLSPIVADLFVHLMEESVIRKHIENGNLIFYSRYVDDVCAIHKTGTEIMIQNEMNSFDNFLSFTTEKMTNNSLPFLDTEIYVDQNDTVQLKFYKKTYFI